MEVFCLALTRVAEGEPTQRDPGGGKGGERINLFTGSARCGNRDCQRDESSGSGSTELKRRHTEKGNGEKKTDVKKLTVGVILLLHSMVIKRGKHLY